MRLQGEARLCLLAMLFAAAFSPGISPAQPGTAGREMSFSISSGDFKTGTDIPSKFTCDGANTSPELSWTEPPPATRSFALVADDPDAPGGTFTHWVLFNLPGIRAACRRTLPRLTNCRTARDKVETVSARSVTEALVRLQASLTAISSSFLHSTLSWI
jgi:phosphatidylethanolamine-binding protein (PEBP) family uncharacterized protein